MKSEGFEEVTHKWVIVVQNFHVGYHQIFIVITNNKPLISLPA